MIIASVVLEKTAFSYDKFYDYLVPDSLSFCKPGCRVTVPFGRGNVVRQGIVFSIREADEIFQDLKSVCSVEDDNPVLSAEMIRMCEWMRERTFCTYFDAVRSMLPLGLGIKIVKSYSILDPENFCEDALNETELQICSLLMKSSPLPIDEIQKRIGLEQDSEYLEKLVEKGVLVRNDAASRRMGDATQRNARLTAAAEDYTPTSKQAAVIEMLQDIGAASVKELSYYTGVSLSVISSLEKKGVIEFFEEEIFRAPYIRVQRNERKEIVLNSQQQAAFNGLEELYSSLSPSVSLLYGVTGSGKTQIYLKLVDKALDDGKNVIVMVPEISLTPQTLRLFSDRYGDKIALFHSAMSLGQRMDEWKRVKNGSASIAIGTRSAIFAPMDNIGLVIIDEEQEHTYKSEQSPRFDARELAKFRVAEHNALLVLASATPSVESYSAAKSGRYSLFCVNERYGNAVLPEVITVDMRAEILSGMRGTISDTLRERIAEVLSKSEQAIVLLNRRGHNNFLSCPSCGEVASCPNCSVSLTYHSANHRLMCHYCGYSIEHTGKCPSCGNDHIRLMGMGTQLVEQELKGLFPNARVLRMDADSTMSRRSYSEKLSAFSNGEYDIMLGTQMVAKGLDFPKVTLVGVIGADQAMYSDDYRSYERTFSLITQVIGRSGRGDGKGTAVIQTVSPDSLVIKLAAKQDYDAFYDEEIKTRKLMIYPPYCDIAVAVVSSSDSEVAKDVCASLFNAIREHIDSDYSDIKLMILGPAPATVERVGGKYRHRMIFKCRNNARLRDLMRASIAQMNSQNRNKDYSYYIDIDPERIP